MDNKSSSRSKNRGDRGPSGHPGGSSHFQRNDCGPRGGEHGGRGRGLRGRAQRGLQL
ncbi:hypothetical protein SCLCIDRAFT_1214659 [Scleroderma citrinum Foug A]|uniref:Uncharacterized protein n=1 Tax=Scleroderma citrinum Foug A TaxID=1036808 RepID=A0A0C3E4A0_9AGAM|nr:hypothetical protein SCLCIDRAFT_1214659 [Scleroderma citrinum Foug A]